MSYSNIESFMLASQSFATDTGKNGEAVTLNFGSKLDRDLLINAYLSLRATPKAPPQTSPDAGVGSDGAADQSYLVWSNEHRAWWNPGERGYTRKVARAGRYSREAAIKIASTRGGGWPVDGNPYEIAIPERDAIEQASA